MRIEFTLTDNSGNKYQGTTELFEASPITTGSPTVPAKTTSGDPKGLPDYILDLRGQGFFSQPRAPSEVHSQLLRNYHCEFERVKVALLRLQRRRELRKTAKEIAGQERVAYVW